jgi:hypothetical protein
VQLRILLEYVANIFLYGLDLIGAACVDDAAELALVKRGWASLVPAVHQELEEDAVL